MRTYDWNGHTGLEMSYSHRSDKEVATRVRMLLRDDLDHEAVCTMARDRIMALVKEKAALQARLDAEGWQTLDSAPADGETEVLLWYPSVGRPVFGVTHRYTTSGKVFATSSMVRGPEPTHWHPIPAGPETRKD